MTAAAIGAGPAVISPARKVALFVRGSALGGTWILPLAGAGSVGVAPAIGELLLLIATATAFHIFAYVLNDVIDLPIDRSEPRRAQSPLVTGTVSPRLARIVAILCASAGCLLAAAISAAPLSIGLLLLAYTFMAGYDLWGKKTPLPWVTDIIQGISWAALLGWGAAAIGTPTMTTWSLGAYVVLFIVMANGVHGSLRDLANDLRCGARSTAIRLGARPVEHGGVVVTPALTWYAATLHAALVLLALTIVVTNDLRFPVPAFVAVISSTALISAAASYFGVRAWQHLDDGWAIRHDGLLHLSLMVAVPLVVVAPALHAAAGALAAAAFLVPLAAHRWLPGALRTIRHRRFGGTADQSDSR